jgi:isoquinoline 1-oxidoreductase alpha subunit
MISLNLNGKTVALDVEPDTPLLWALRDFAGLTGTKYGCGVAQCGSCSVHINGEVLRSCSIPVGSVKPTDRIVTIEAIGATRAGKAVQDAWVAENVPQCGYCQSGQIMSAAALLATKKNPNDADIDEAMAGVLCRCATYLRIRAAIKRAAAGMA